MQDLLGLAHEFADYLSTSGSKFQKVPSYPSLDKPGSEDAFNSAITSLTSSSASNVVFVDGNAIKLLPGNYFDLLGTYGPGFLIKEEKGAFGLPVDSGKVRLIPGKRYITQKLGDQTKKETKKDHAPTLPSVFQVNMFNTGAELEPILVANAAARPRQALLKQIMLGFMAALWTTFSGTFALVGAGGLSAEFRSTYPIVPKLMMAAFFPVNLILIILIGGDLFTGNCMFMPLAWAHGKATVRQVFQNWFVSWNTNFWGCLFFGYILTYETGLLQKEPYRSWAISVAEGKAALSFGVVFDRAIGANALVCLAITLANLGKDSWSRMFGAWLPIFTFVGIGFEHVVANMFFMTVGMMYGANVNVGKLIVHSLIPSTLGNLVGAWIVALALWFVYGFNPKPVPGTWFWKIWTWGNWNGPDLLKEYEKEKEIKAVQEFHRKQKEHPESIALEMAALTSGKDASSSSAGCLLSVEEQEQYRSALDKAVQQQAPNLIRFQKHYVSRKFGVVNVEIKGLVVVENGKSTRLACYCFPQQSSQQSRQQSRQPTPPLTPVQESAPATTSSSSSSPSPSAASQSQVEVKCEDSSARVVFFHDGEQVQAHETPKDESFKFSDLPSRCFFILDALNRSFIFADDSFCSLIGYSEEDLLYKVVEEDKITSVDDQSLTQQVVEQQVRSMLKQWRPDLF